jgi:hypothetical protein
VGWGGVGRGGVGWGEGGWGGVGGRGGVGWSGVGWGGGGEGMKSRPVERACAQTCMGRGWGWPRGRRNGAGSRGRGKPPRRQPQGVEGGSKERVRAGAASVAKPAGSHGLRCPMGARAGAVADSLRRRRARASPGYSVWRALGGGASPKYLPLSVPPARQPYAHSLGGGAGWGWGRGGGGGGRPAATRGRPQPARVRPRGCAGGAGRAPADDFAAANPPARRGAPDVVV